MTKITLELTPDEPGASRAIAEAVGEALTRINTKTAEKPNNADAQSLRPGDALVRDWKGTLRRVRVREFIYRPNNFDDAHPPITIEGSLIETITE